MTSLVVSHKPLCCKGWCPRLPPGQNLTDFHCRPWVDSGAARPACRFETAHFEAHTWIIHSLKNKVEATDRLPVRKHNTAERDDRTIKAWLVFA